MPGYKCIKKQKRKSIFQEICSRAENFLILSFSSPGRGVRSTIQEKTNNPPRIPDTYFPDTKIFA